MVRRFVAAASLLSAASVVMAQEPPLSLTNKLTLVATYPIAVHQLPFTTVHEGTHALTARMLGARDVRVRLLPGTFVGQDGKRHVAMAYEQHRTMSSGREAAVEIAPYLVQLFAVDRLIEAGYRRGTIRIDTLGDKYLQAALLINADTPLWNTAFKHGDIARFSEKIHVNRFIVGAALQAAYLYSGYRIAKARGDTNSQWVMYVHITKTF